MPSASVNPSRSVSPPTASISPIAYRTSKVEAEQLAESISEVETTTIQADLSLEDDARDAVAQTVKTLGGLDYVVNLASDYPYAPFDSLDDSAWEQAMASAKGSYLLGVHAARQDASKLGSQPRAHNNVRRLGR